MIGRKPSTCINLSCSSWINDPGQLYRFKVLNDRITEDICSGVLVPYCGYAVVEVTTDTVSAD